jgi:hypothetical protein
LLKVLKRASHMKRPASLSTVPFFFNLLP